MAERISATQLGQVLGTNIMQRLYELFALHAPPHHLASVVSARGEGGKSDGWVASARDPSYLHVHRLYPDKGHKPVADWF